MEFRWRRSARHRVIALRVGCGNLLAVCWPTGVVVAAHEAVMLLRQPGGAPEIACQGCGGCAGEGEHDQECGCEHRPVGGQEFKWGVMAIRPRFLRNARMRGIGHAGAGNFAPLTEKSPSLRLRTRGSAGREEARTVQLHICSCVKLLRIMAARYRPRPAGRTLRT